MSSVPVNSDKLFLFMDMIYEENKIKINTIKRQENEIKILKKRLKEKEEEIELLLNETKT